MDYYVVSGFFGISLAVIAYLPQIVHLIKEQCTDGLSKRAYWLWLISSVLILLRAVSMYDVVFISLQIIQTFASGTILFYVYRYRGSVCMSHRRMAGA